MEKRNISHFTPDQLVAEIRRAREDLEDTARYMGAASLLLHARTRRSDFRESARQTAVIPEDTSREATERLRQTALNEASSIYTLYANTWHRFSGMILQGVKRTASSERIMRRLEDKRVVARDVEPVTPTPQVKPVKEPEAPAPMNDLVELYGIETVTHAQR
jgi:hypothetical protein